MFSACRRRTRRTGSRCRRTDSSSICIYGARLTDQDPAALRVARTIGHGASVVYNRIVAWINANAKRVLAWINGGIAFGTILEWILRILGIG